jgi:hypothetical protein
MQSIKKLKILVLFQTNKIYKYILVYIAYSYIKIKFL